MKRLHWIFFAHPALFVVPFFLADADPGAVSKRLWDEPRPSFEPPAPPTRARIDFPEEMKDLSAEVELSIRVNRRGLVEGVEALQSSHQAFGAIVAEEVRGWVFRAARRDGKRIASRVVQRFVYNEGVQRSNVAELDRMPVAVSSPLPKLPEGANAPGGFALVYVTIDARGDVVDASIRDSSDARIEELCLETARQWKFSPGVREGRPAPSSLVIPLSIAGG